MLEFLAGKVRTRLPFQIGCVRFSGYISLFSSVAWTSSVVGSVPQTHMQIQRTKRDAREIDRKWERELYACYYH